MKTIGLARLGKDAEVRYTPAGKAVCNLSLATVYGQKGDDGNRPTQWIEATLWGDRAEALAQYLVKGSVHCFTLSEVHNETYQRNNGGEGFKMMARVDDIELGPRVANDNGGQQRQERPAQSQQRPEAQPQRQASPPPDDGDDIPF